jgi:hypothetical protein
MTTPQAAPAGWMKHIAGILLGINALDVTTSLIPYWIDVYEPPPRSTVEWVVQLALLALALVWLATLAPAITARLRALPVPRGAFIATGAFIAIELAHIALRYERYPFSPVAMFSDAHVDIPDTREQPALLIRRPDGTEIFSFQREGDPLFAQHFVDLDYKGSAVLRMYRDAPRVHEIVSAQLAERGLPPPEPVYVRYRTSDGEVLAITPRVPEPSAQGDMP